MERIAAGAIVFLSLTILADIPATSRLAVAFAYVILLSAALTVGPTAFGRISELVGAPRTGSAGSGAKKA